MFLFLRQLGNLTVNPSHRSTICGNTDGKIAVFLPDKNVPETVFEVYTSTLPSYDRGQLQLGIPIQSYEELVKRIEDYIS